MDLSALGSTLPAGLADAEREMGDKFRASALSITNLYKSSLGYTKQAYQVGYSACLVDVLSTVQSSIGAGQDATQTLSRLMDWAEARETAMAAFAAEEGDDTPLNTPAQPHPHRRAALTRHQIHLQASAANRPSSAPIPESYYHHRTPQTQGVIDSSPGPSRLRTRSGPVEDTEQANQGMEDGSRGTGADPDQTFVHGSTPLSLDTSPAHNLRPLQTINPGGASTHLGAPSSSPTVASRPIHGGNGRISRSPLRYRHDSSSASTSSSVPSVPFAPSLPPNLAHFPTQQSLLALPQLASSAIPIGLGSKRPIAAVHLDSDLDVAMTDDGITGVGVPRGGRASKRRNLDKRGESRDARDGEPGAGDGSGKEREERRRGRKGKDIGGG